MRIMIEAESMFSGSYNFMSPKIIEAVMLIKACKLA